MGGPEENGTVWSRERLSSCSDSAPSSEGLVGTEPAAPTVGVAAEVTRGLAGPPPALRRRHRSDLAAGRRLWLGAPRHPPTAGCSARAECRDCFRWPARRRPK